MLQNQKQTVADDCLLLYIGGGSEEQSSAHRTKLYHSYPHRNTGYTFDPSEQLIQFFRTHPV